MTMHLKGKQIKKRAAPLGLFLCIGLGLIGGAMYSFYNAKQFDALAIRTDGVVEELDFRRSSDGSGSYYPVIRWQMQDGQSYRFTGSFGTNPSAYKKGERVEVLYIPGDHDSARLGGIMGKWALPLMLGAMGIIFSIVAYVGLSSPGNKENTR